MCVGGGGGDKKSLNVTPLSLVFSNYCKSFPCVNRRILRTNYLLLINLNELG